MATANPNTDTNQQRVVLPMAFSFPRRFERLRIGYRHVGQPSFRYSTIRRSRNAFAITENELSVIAALAIIGLSRIPKWG